MAKGLNRKEINQYIRTISKEEKEKDCKCYICQSKKNIQLHHLIRVKDLGDIAWRNSIRTKDKLNDLYIPTEFVCENCHQMIHSLQSDNYQECSINLDKASRIIDMYSEIDLEEVQEELLCDYIDVLNRQEHLAIYNIIEFGDFSLEELDFLEEYVNEQLSDNFEEEFIDQSQQEV